MAVIDPQQRWELEGVAGAGVRLCIKVGLHLQMSWLQKHVRLLIPARK